MPRNLRHAFPRRPDPKSAGGAANAETCPPPPLPLPSAGAPHSGGGTARGGVRDRVRAGDSAARAIDRGRQDGSDGRVSHGRPAPWRPSTRRATNPPRTTPSSPSARAGRSRRGRSASSRSGPPATTALPCAADPSRTLPRASRPANRWASASSSSVPTTTSRSAVSHCLASRYCPVQGWPVARPRNRQRQCSTGTGVSDCSRSTTARHRRTAMPGGSDGETSHACSRATTCPARTPSQRQSKSNGPRAVSSITAAKGPSDMATASLR